jgi:transposase InsO family protein
VEHGAAHKKGTRSKTVSQQSFIKRCPSQSRTKQVCTTTKAVANSPFKPMQFSVFHTEQSPKRQLPNIVMCYYTSGNDPCKDSFLPPRSAQTCPPSLSNNLIACFNKQFKAWYRTKRGFSAFAAANNLVLTFVFFFNFVGPHSALNGLPPAQVAGISFSPSQKRKFPLVVKLLYAFKRLTLRSV